MRLRPSGNKGPAATQFRGFVAYHAAESETWERLALTRARPVAGDESLRVEASAAIAEVLTRRGEPAAILEDARGMRALIAQEKGEDDPWDLKLAAGGLLDVEFVAQTLVLLHAHAHRDLLTTETAAVLERVRELHLLPDEDADLLRRAFALMRDVFHWQRLTVAGRFDPAVLGPGLRMRLAAVVGMPDFAMLERELQAMRHQVREAFERFMRGG